MHKCTMHLNGKMSLCLTQAFQLFKHGYFLIAIRVHTYLFEKPSILFIVLSEWSTWSDGVCSVSCGGGGTRTVVRECKEGDGTVVGNDLCEGGVSASTGETVSCGTGDCPGN